MNEQTNHRAEQEAVRQAAKASDMRMAKENEKAPFAEKVKQQKDQERRRQIVERNIENYESNVVPKLQAKVQKNQELM